MPRIGLALAVVFVAGLLLTVPALATTHYFTPVRAHHGRLVFKVGGIDPAKVRAVYLKVGPYRQDISIKRLRSATRRGILKLRVPKRARHHRSHRKAHGASLSDPTLVVVTSDTSTTTPTASTTTTSSISTFTPAADAYVLSSRKKSNYGGASELRADSSPTTRSYLRFNVQGLTSTVTRATLKLYATSGSPAGFDLRSVSDTSWDEQTISYANAPAAGGVTASSGVFGSGQWLSLDVTPLVKTDGGMGVALTTASGGAISLASRETGANAPQLVVETGTVTDPSISPSPSPSPAPSPSPSPAPDLQPTLPIRAAFYYPWFPETWTKNGATFTHYHPSLGFYDSSSTTVIQQHVRALEYGGINVGISSWWGQGHNTDKRLPIILNTTTSMASNLRWSTYYEKESLGDPTVSELASDLGYIRDHYGSDPSYFRINGRFVVFVYADGADSCGMVDRWKQANAGINAYIVLKVFSGYRLCLNQPDGWHQYSPAVAADSQSGYSYSISPGFWKADETLPRLTRDITRWNQNIRDMISSNAPFQLVVSFNEWGEGTAVESATEWASTSGYGTYLDALHNNGQLSTPVNLPPIASFTISPNPADTGQTVTFDGSGSSDTDGSVTNYKWDLDGNGTFETDTGSTPTASRSYSTAQSVTVKLRVTDSGGATGDASKTLTVNAPAGTDPVIAAAGDIACDPGDANFNSGNGTANACRQKYTSDLLVSAGLAGVLTLGDNQYDDSTLVKYQTVFDPTWGRVKSIIHPGIGNHEYNTSGATGYFDYYNGLGNASGPAGDRSKGYYSFDVGSWHVIALNSNCSKVGGCAAGQPEEQWLRSDLAAHTASCTLAYWHHPHFSSGNHGNDDGGSNPTGAFWQALYDANADLVLNGHDHDYERFAPQTPAGAADTARGIRQFVVGTGGRNHYSFTTIRANSEVRNSTAYGVLKLTLHPGSYDWRFVPETGSSLSDSGSGTCH